MTDLNFTWPNRLKIACAVGAILSLVAVAWRMPWTYAHEGHGTEEVGENDLDAPRTVSDATAEHIGLEIVEVTQRIIEETLEISGIVRARPDRRAAVVSGVAGRVLTVSKQVGDSVKKNELLVTIESPEYARSLYDVRRLDVEYRKLLLEIQKAKGIQQVIHAKSGAVNAKLKLARAELARAESLAGQGVPRKEVLRRRTDVEILASEIEVANTESKLAGKEAEALREQADALRLSRRAMLAINNISPTADTDAEPSGKVLIRAAMAGKVIHRSALPGQWIEAGHTLMEIADYSEVQVEGEVPESLIARIRSRQSKHVRVRIPADPEYLEEGSIRFMAPELDPIKRTAHLIVDVPNKDGVLRGGMWANLTVVLRQAKKAWVIPKSAEVVHGPMHFVFLKTGSDQYQKRDIEPGIRDDRYVQVKAGVAPGDKVVSQGAYSLTHLRPKKKSKPDGNGGGK